LLLTKADIFGVKVKSQENQESQEKVLVNGLNGTCAQASIACGHLG
jgi:hypothetical protein